MLLRKNFYKILIYRNRYIMPFNYVYDDKIYIILIKNWNLKYSKYKYLYLE
jgi:hypothetical protein